MEEKFRRRRLPHWDLSGATYFITACLAGSIPAQGLLDIAGEGGAGYESRIVGVFIGAGPGPMEYRPGPSVTATGIG
jgi:hypothetical protein